MRQEQQAAHRPDDTTPFLPGLALARFCATYPGMNPVRGWEKTRDGSMPSRLFFLLYRAIPSIEAGQTLGEMAAIGLSLGGGENDNETKRRIRELKHTAYPELADG